MPHWSPKGDWIVLASDRDDDFHVWLIEPDGSDRRNLFGAPGICVRTSRRNR